MRKLVLYFYKLVSEGLWTQPLESGIVLSLCCSFFLYLFADKDLQILVKNGFNSMEKSDYVRTADPEELSATVPLATVTSDGSVVHVTTASRGRRGDDSTGDSLFGSDAGLHRASRSDNW